MRIVEIINSLTYRGGAQVLLASLSEQFKNKNNDVIVISLFDNIDHSFVEYFKKHNIEFLTLSKKSKFDFKCSKKLKYIIKQFDPDVIHMHLSCLPSYFLAFGLKKRKWCLCETIHSIPGTTLSKSGKILRKIYLKKDILKLVSISNTIQKSSIELYGENKVALINNGVSLGSFSYCPKEFDFIIVASLSEVKNHSMLIDAFSKIFSNNKIVKLLIVGEGPLKDNLINKIKQYSLEKNIILYGSTNDVYSLLLKSKVFILASKREGNPLSIIEAMSVGLPIVAPRVGGIPDVVEDGVNGYLFEPENVDECTDKMLKALNCYPTFKDQNIKKASMYSIETCAEQYLNMFLKYLKQKNQ